MIERCTHYRDIRKLRKNFILVSSKAYYLMDVQNGENVGLWSFIPEDGRMTTHVDMTPAYRGHRAFESGRDAVRWMFDNTDHSTLYADIPNTHRHAQFMCKKVGGRCISRDDTSRTYEMSKTKGDA